MCILFTETIKLLCRKNFYFLELTYINTHKKQDLLIYLKKYAEKSNLLKIKTNYNPSTRYNKTSFFKQKVVFKQLAYT